MVYPGMHRNGTAEILGTVILNLGRVFSQETRLSASDLSSGKPSALSPLQLYASWSCSPSGMRLPPTHSSRQLHLINANYSLLNNQF